MPPGTSYTPPKCPLNAPPIPHKALTLSRKVDECKPLLPVHVEHTSFTAYSHLSLDEELRKDLALAGDLGITLDPMVLNQYQVPREGPGALDPADLALLEAGAYTRSHFRST